MYNSLSAGPNRWALEYKTVAEQEISEGIIERFRQLRLRCYGPRGKGKFARDLGISPSTYSYYERDRVPPVQLLVRASRLTGCRLDWLAKGEGRPFPDAGDVSQVLSDQKDTARGVVESDSQRVVERLLSIVGKSPKALAAVHALTEVLAEAYDAQSRRRVPADGGSSTAAEASRSDDVRSGQTQPLECKELTPAPVLGRVAAGIPMFWADNEEAREFADLVKLASGVIRQGRCRVLWQREAADQLGQVQLVQLAAPLELGAVEVTELLMLRAGDELAGKELFAAWVDGDSMSPMINHGDLVAASPQAPAVDGQVALVQLAGQIGATCKIYRKQGRKVHLTPANAAYAATVHPADQVVWALNVLYRIELKDSGDER